MTKKIQSVTELAKYQVGDVAYWVIMRPQTVMADLAEEDDWMLDYHPKALYTIGPGRKAWPYHSKLPRLHQVDFECIIELLRSKLVVEPFIINEIIRSRNTGEFLYANDDEEWMPESCLFDTDIAANRERNRIKKMINNWSSND